MRSKSVGGLQDGEERTFPRRFVVVVPDFRTLEREVEPRHVVLLPLSILVLAKLLHLLVYFRLADVAPSGHLGKAALPRLSTNSQEFSDLIPDNSINLFSKIKEFLGNMPSCLFHNPKYGRRTPHTHQHLANSSRHISETSEVHDASKSAICTALSSSEATGMSSPRIR